MIVTTTVYRLVNKPNIYDSEWWTNISLVCNGVAHETARACRHNNDKGWEQKRGIGRRKKSLLHMLGQAPTDCYKMIQSGGRGSGDHKRGKYFGCQISVAGSVVHVEKATGETRANWSVPFAIYTGLMQTVPRPIDRLTNKRGGKGMAPLLLRLELAKNVPIDDRLPSC